MEQSRRRFLGLAASAAAAAAHPAVAATGVLKKWVRGRTVNIHAHLKANDWYLWDLSTAQRRDAITAELTKVQTDVMANATGLSPHVVKEYVERASRRAATSSLEEITETYLAECDSAGIDLIANQTMDHLPTAGPGGTHMTASFERILEDNKRVRDRFPGRIVSFAGVDPRRGKEAVRLFEVAVKDYGCIGFGEMIGTLWQTMPNDRTLCYPLLEKAAELGVPYVQDATQAKGFSEPKIFEQLARDFPKLQICLAGAGAGVPKVSTPNGERLAHDVLLELAERHENLWLDIDDWQSMGIKAGLPARSDEAVRISTDFVHRALKGPARNRIMYGSDFPVYARLYSEADWITRFLDQARRDGAPFSREDLELFFSKNALRFLATSRYYR